jgi:hypothetical protein
VHEHLGTVPAGAPARRTAPAVVVASFLNIASHERGGVARRQRGAALGKETRRTSSRAADASP